MNKEKIKSIYKQLKSLEKKFEADKGWFHASLIQGTYHSLIDELTEATKEDCSKYKIPNSEYQVMDGTTPIYRRLPTLTHIGMAVGFVENLLNISDANISSGSGNERGITIINQNTLAVSIQNTINQLIEEIGSVTFSTLVVI
ncbi:hypothetical protein KKC45_03520 [Patescibacteria group bacterium]|nr:hypothetical protein [Patescibacteria group bacterium]